MDAKNSEKVLRSKTIAKVGILLAVQGVALGAILILVATNAEKLMQALGESLGPMTGPPLPRFREFAVDTIYFAYRHVIIMESVAVAFFAAGLTIYRQSKIQRYSN